MAPVLNKTPAMVLQELCVKKKLNPPTFEMVYSQSGTHSNRFDYHVAVGSVVGKGTGSSKQISKHEAALDALKQLQELDIYDPLEMPTEEFKPQAINNTNTVPQNASNNVPPSPFKISPNCVGMN